MEEEKIMAEQRRISSDFFQNKDKLSDGFNNVLGPEFFQRV